MSQPRLILLAGLILSCPVVASAQMAQAIADGIANSGGPPAITSITPPGSPLGKTIEWTVAGSNLAAVAEWRISGKGVSLVATATGKDSAKLRARVDPDAEPGYREVRALGPNGVSNLALVRIDHQDLVAEIEPNDTIENATGLPLGLGGVGRSESPGPRSLPRCGQEGPEGDDRPGGAASGDADFARAHRDDENRFRAGASP